MWKSMSNCFAFNWIKVPCLLGKGFFRKISCSQSPKMAALQGLGRGKWQGLVRAKEHILWIFDCMNSILDETFFALGPWTWPFSCLSGQWTLAGLGANSYLAALIPSIGRNFEADVWPNRFPGKALQKGIEFFPLFSKRKRSYGTHCSLFTENICFPEGIPARRLENGQVQGAGFGQYFDNISKMGIPLPKIIHLNDHIHICHFLLLPFFLDSELPWRHGFPPLFLFMGCSIYPQV